MFIGCSLIPIVLLAALSYTQITSQLTEEAKRRLHQETKSYGMTVYERIGLLQTTLQLISSNIKMNLDLSAVHNFVSKDNLIKKKFKTLNIFIGKDAPIPLIGRMDHPPTANEAEREYINTGKSALLVRNQGDSPSQIFMLRLVDPNNPLLGFVIGEIDTGYLWGLDYEGSFVRNKRLLLLDHRKEVLLNTSLAPVAYLKKLISQMNNSDIFQIEWEYEGKEIITSVRPIFLKSNFLITDFTIA